MKACWLMTNSQNPLGFYAQRRREKGAPGRVAAISINVTLIEDDVYSELYFGREKPLPAKAWDRARRRFALFIRSRSAWCPDFAWAGSPPGSMHVRIQRLAAHEHAYPPAPPCSLRSWITCPPAATTPICAACAASWRNANSSAWQALLRHLPAEVKIHHSDSGYFLWLELPEPLRCRRAQHRQALAHHISIAPGKMFSTSVETGHVFFVLIPRGTGESVRNRR